MNSLYAWETITSDVYILNVVESGLQLNFTGDPLSMDLLNMLDLLSNLRS